MIYIGIFLAIGCLFLALLFCINVYYGDKRARSIVATLVIGAIIGIVLMVVGIHREQERPVYNFRVRAYFLDGAIKYYTITSKDEPRVNAYRGTYWMNNGDRRILGVIRCEVLSKTEAKR